MFEQFMKLPPAQKAGVLAAVLAVIGAGVYFMVIESTIAATEKNEVQLKRMQTELTQLRDSARTETVTKLRKSRDDLVERDKENRKMLPTSDEIPDFIDLVQQDAVSAGLRVTRFDRLPTQSEDLVNAVPVKMSVQGTMLDLIAFMRVYASGGRRVINIRALSIEEVKADMGKVRLEWKASKPLEDMSLEASHLKSDDERLVERIEMLELARKKAAIRATFVAYAYTWTGKAAKVGPGGAGRKKAKKKRT